MVLNGCNLEEQASIFNSETTGDSSKLPDTCSVTVWGKETIGSSLNWCFTQLLPLLVRVTSILACLSAAEAEPSERKSKHFGWCEHPASEGLKAFCT